MSARYTLDPSLLEHAITPRQRAVAQAVLDAGGVRPAADALGICVSTVREIVRKLESRAAAADPTLHATSAPTGYHLRGVSTLLDSAGIPKLTWVKTQRDREEQLAALREALVEIVEPYRGVVEPAPAPIETDADLLNVIPFGDTHIGMLAWARETGQDWDVRIAERVIRETLDSVLRAMPNAQRSLLILLGDWFHRPDSSNRTPAAGNILDADSRHGKMLETGLRIARHAIDETVRRHALTDVWVCPGNHDGDVALMLAIALKAIYERDARVRVDAEPDPFHYLEFGQSLIASTHGHLCKPAKLPSLLAARRREAWGRTRWHHWYLGHVHHETTHEHPACVVETKRAVSPKDAWAHGAGFEADRDITCDTWHRVEGRIGRIWRCVGGGL